MTTIVPEYDDAAPGVYTTLFDQSKGPSDFVPPKIPPTPPPPPTGLQPPTNLVATPNNHNGIDLTWTDEPEATEYMFYRDGVLAGYLSAPYAPYFPLTDGSLIPGDTHSYYLVSVKGSQMSGPSNIATATDQIPAYPVPPPDLWVDGQDLSQGFQLSGLDIVQIIDKSQWAAQVYAQGSNPITMFIDPGGFRWARGFAPFIFFSVTNQSPMTPDLSVGIISMFVVRVNGQNNDSQFASIFELTSDAGDQGNLSDTYALGIDQNYQQAALEVTTSQGNTSAETTIGVNVVLGQPFALWGYTEPDPSFPDMQLLMTGGYQSGTESIQSGGDPIEDITLAIGSGPLSSYPEQSRWFPGDVGEGVAWSMGPGYVNTNDLYATWLYLNQKYADAPLVVPGPAAPTNLTANVTSSTTVDLSWDSVSGAVTYSLFRGTSPGGEDPTPISTGSGTSFNDTGLTTGTTYYYYVVATNSGGGVSSPSNEVSATPAATVYTPTFIAGISCGAVATISGIPSGSDCCSPHNYPFIGPSFGYWGELDGTAGNDLSATIILTVTSLDNSAHGCGSIDPIGFPTCGFIIVFMNGSQVARIDIPTAPGVYTYDVETNVSDGTATITPV